MNTPSHRGALAENDPAADRSFELAFRPNVALVTSVRRFVTEFYGLAKDADDVGARVALATHELLENAVKYATDGETVLRVEVHATGRVTVSTWNRASDENVEALRRAFDAISAATDRLSFYQVQLRRTAKQAAGSGLGLARIYSEAEMTVRLIVEGNRVAVVAQTSIDEVAL